VLDAGSLCSALPLERLLEVEDIVLSHSHLDHVKDLPLLADLLVGRREKPINVWASRECAKTIKESIFNDALWPDFTRIPSKQKPIIKIHTFRAGSVFEVGKYKIRSVPVTHPVESCGFVVSNGHSALAMSGDTGPTDKLWDVLNDTPNLKALLLETSFPNHLQTLADLSGHLTPRTVEEELKKFNRNGAAVLLYHLKPAFVTELKEELASLPVEVLELGDTFEL
jgi:ribonuclease BN (tRNA processing enzyme)